MEPINWSQAQKDWLRVGGVKIKVRAYVRKLAVRLPPLILKGTGQRVNHREQLIKAYLAEGVEGLKIYRKGVMENHKI